VRALAGKCDRFQDRRAFDFPLVEGALCAWEHMIEQRDSETFKELFEQYGSAAMRSCAMQAGAICDLVYKHMEAAGYEFHSAYDWEFVPAVCNLLDWPALIDDNQYSGPAYKPDIRTLFAAILDAPEIAEHFERSDVGREKDKRFSWMAEAKRYAAHIWCFEGLIDEHQERADAAFAAGEDVYQFVQELGEAYDLQRADQDWQANYGKPFTRKL